MSSRPGCIDPRRCLCSGDNPTIPADEAIPLRSTPPSRSRTQDDPGSPFAKHARNMLSATSLVQAGVDSSASPCGRCRSSIRPIAERY